MVEHTAERRALIVEDETLFAMSLSVDMQALGFANCDLAATGQDAFLKAMEDLPDIVLMDVNLEEVAKGSRLPDGFARYATYLLSSSLHTPTATPSLAFTNRCRAHQ